MSMKGSLRSLNSLANSIERDTIRKQRELEKQRLQYARMQALEQAAYEVEVYENSIDVMISLHKDSTENVNWNEVINKERPVEPYRTSTNEDKARRKLEDFTPNIFDKIFSKIERKRKDLQDKIILGKGIDDKEYSEALNNYRKELDDWKQVNDLAVRIIAGDNDAYVEAINQLNPFSEIANLGSNISFEIIDDKLVEATLNVNGDSVIPKESKSLLKSGKLSTKRMTSTKFNALYQDYVCSALLRVARELFAILPIEMVIIHAVGELLNTSTGHFEKQTILSVCMPKETIQRLNFELLDPSDSLENFVHQMNFKQTKGFSPIKKIKPSELDR